MRLLRLQHATRARMRMLAGRIHLRLPSQTRTRTRTRAVSHGRTRRAVRGGVCAVAVCVLGQQRGFTSSRLDGVVVRERRWRIASGWYGVEDRLNQVLGRVQSIEDR